jgi:D-tyrosyl-tRNA(Tyr) deacylase
MRLVIQRVSEASVSIAGSTYGSIRTGLVVLVGISKTDTQEDALYLSDKVLGLRIFPDDSGKMNRNIREAEGSLLIVSQFTLYADCRRGRRPSFDQAASPQEAVALYDYFVSLLRQGPVPVETGIFQAMMEIHLVNQGPVTILIDSIERTKK